MDSFKLLNGLNDKQREAVCTSYSSLLVLAGAGSGKTRVLAHRIAWLLSTHNYSPYSIIAVTFTNKAASEMRNRISQLISIDQNDMWIGTFHSLAHRLLRTHYIDAHLPKDFQILDNEDQLRLLKRLIKEMNLDDIKWSARQSAWFINNKKDKGLRHSYIKNYGNAIERTWLHIYQVYQETCNRAGLVDFSELLLRVNELLLNKPQILNHYQKRFTNILVDEFQDTNNIQYNWIHMLAGNTGRIFIVGDDDQSIYGWRGAQVKNIQRFLHDFPKTKTVRLEQNYRSTNNILKAANALIANNNNRLGKKLWTNDSNGEPISLYCASNELDEARFVINCIKTFYKNGYILSDSTILYRSNFQSRVLEEALRQANIPYRIHGGIRFFERQEIKDALAYLRLMVNRNDDAAFERIINTPLRGIGNRTLDIIRQIAREKQVTLWQATNNLLQSNSLTNRTIIALRGFCELIESLAIKTAELPLHIQTNRIIKDSGLWLMYEQEKGEQSKIRLDNLKELVTATRQFNHQDKELIPLQAFLYKTVLEVGESEYYKRQDSVQLMTLHSAKGLEFKMVFIVGMEEGMFPIQMSLDEWELLEEERRLAYVGLTRAMKKITLTYSQVRNIYGKTVYHRPSRFISELPKECIKEIGFCTTIDT